MTAGLFSKRFSGNEADDFKGFIMNKGFIQTSVIDCYNGICSDFQLYFGLLNKQKNICLCIPWSQGLSWGLSRIWRPE